MTARAAATSHDDPPMLAIDGERFMGAPMLAIDGERWVRLDEIARPIWERQDWRADLDRQGAPWLRLWSSSGARSDWTPLAGLCAVSSVAAVAAARLEPINADLPISSLSREPIAPAVDPTPPRRDPEARQSFPEPWRARNARQGPPPKKQAPAAQPKRDLEIVPRAPRPAPASPTPRPKPKPSTVEDAIASVFARALTDAVERDPFLPAESKPVSETVSPWRLAMTIHPPQEAVGPLNVIRHDDHPRRLWMSRSNLRHLLSDGVLHNWLRGNDDLRLELGRGDLRHIYSAAAGVTSLVDVGALAAHALARLASGDRRGQMTWTRVISALQPVLDALAADPAPAASIPLEVPPKRRSRGESIKPEAPKQVSALSILGDQVARLTEQLTETQRHAHRIANHAQLLEGRVQQLEELLRGHARAALHRLPETRR